MNPSQPATPYPIFTLECQCDYNPGMSEEGQTTGVAFWGCILLLVLLAYPISMGPACWISSRLGLGANLVSRIYAPVIRICDRGPDSIRKLSMRYSEFGAAEDWAWYLRTLNINQGADRGALQLKVTSWQPPL